MFGDHFLQPFLPQPRQCLTEWEWDISFAQHTTQIDGNFLADYGNDFAAGLLGGCAGLVFGHPFDTIKVRQQTMPCTSLSNCVRTTMQADGVRGFFRGLAFPLGAVGVLNSIFFGVYGNTLKSLSLRRDPARTGTDPLYRDIFVAGSFAGAVQAIPAAPIELVKVKLQTQVGPTPQYRGPLDCLASIHREHGLRGCFRGLNATVAREIPGFGVYITSYQFLCDQFRTEGQVHCSVRGMLVAGGMAGMLSWVVNIPIDIIKSRLQADDLRRPRYAGMLHCARDSYRAGGLKVFWTGLPVTCMRAFPVNAVTFAVYSTSLQAFQRINSPVKPEAMVLD